jgi:hypothetical protein
MWVMESYIPRGRSQYSSHFIIKNTMEKTKRIDRKEFNKKIIEQGKKNTELKDNGNAITTNCAICGKQIWADLCPNYKGRGHVCFNCACELN